LCELDGLEEEVTAQIEKVSAVFKSCNVATLRVAETEDERLLLWKGRKSAFPAVGRLAPDYYCIDGTIPRGQLPYVLRRMEQLSAEYELPIANVFHAGDGNLHPLLAFDRRQEGVMDRVHAAGADILRVCLEAGGVLSGEHGIGLEKQKFMDEFFTDDDLEHQNRLRQAFDPGCRTNPGKVIPTGHSCADIAALKRISQEVWV